MVNDIMRIRCVDVQYVHMYRIGLATSPSGVPPGPQATRLQLFRASVTFQEVYKSGETLHFSNTTIQFFKMTSLPRKLWQHPAPESTQMGRFQRDLEKSTGHKFDVSEIGLWKDTIYLTSPSPSMICTCIQSRTAQRSGNSAGNTSN